MISNRCKIKNKSGFGGFQRKKMECGVGKFPERNGYEFNRGCWSREEDNEQAAECAANSEETRVVPKCVIQRTVVLVNSFLLMVSLGKYVFGKCVL